MVTRGLSKELTLGHKLARDYKLNKWKYLLILPVLVYLALFAYKPMYGLVIVLKNYKTTRGIAGSDYIGFENFRFVFEMRDFSIALVNTLWLNFLDLIFGFPMPIILAIMLNEMRLIKLKKMSQTMLYLPHFLSWVIIGSVAYQLFKPTTGIVNVLLVKAGLIDTGIPFLTEQNHWAVTYLLIGVWQGMGWGSILYLAAITGISGELYEAALIDGASKWKQTKYITIPLLRPIMSIMLILAVGSVFRSDFGLFYQATRNDGRRVSITSTIDVFVYKALLVNSNINISSSSSFLQSVCGCIMVIAANLAVKKIDPEAGLF